MTTFSDDGSGPPSMTLPRWATVRGPTGNHCVFWAAHFAASPRVELLIGGMEVVHRDMSLLDKLMSPAPTFQYDYPVLGLLGMVSDVVANYNYDKQGTPLNSGVPVTRKYGLEWYEFYAQDSWRMKPNLTLTYGLRWSLFPPPWEVNGFQAQYSRPSFGSDTWRSCPTFSICGICSARPFLSSYRYGAYFLR
jgi:TonB dependent receptor